MAASSITARERSNVVLARMPTSPDSYAALYLREVGEIVQSVEPAAVDELASALADVRGRQGRLFILGVGGGAAHASHAVNDFRKLCDFEAYTPTDNVAEITARTNDEGWETSFDAWLRTSRLSSADAILVFSVGGGSRAHNVSVNLVRAIELAREVGAGVFAVVGRADGAAAEAADVCIVIDAPPERRTPHVEEFQAIVWHLLVSHPALVKAPGKWESVEAARDR
jgi:D-sedoheptulose 7-phosphate isomerase